MVLCSSVGAGDVAEQRAVAKRLCARLDLGDDGKEMRKRPEKRLFFGRFAHCYGSYLNLAIRIPCKTLHCKVTVSTVLYRAESGSRC